MMRLPTMLIMLIGTINAFYFDVVSSGEAFTLHHTLSPTDQPACTHTPRTLHGATLDLDVIPCRYSQC